jgi:Common central domain of tyrosinase/Polyphenol oxidase middle domain
LGSVLYDGKRSPLVNKGTPLDKDSTNADAALKEPNYLAAEWDVESGVHGNVHCETVAYTCPISYMGDVPVAANDPIFYEHHANIDRLWACWQNSHPPVRGEAWLNDQFSFPDETGTLQTRPVSDFISTVALGYVYDNVSQCLRNPPKSPLRTMALQLAPQRPEESTPVLLGSAPAVSLTKPITSVDIAVPQRAMLRLAQPETQLSTVLVLRQITAQSPPGAMLKVYVAAKEKPGLRKYVATINWFNAFGARMKGPNVKTMTYDVSDQLKELGITNGTEGLTVTFEAATGLTAPPASARAAALASFRPEAKLTIGAVELRQPASPR